MPKHPWPFLSEYGQFHGWCLGLKNMEEVGYSEQDSKLHHCFLGYRTSLDSKNQFLGHSMSDIHVLLQSQEIKQLTQTVTRTTYKGNTTQFGCLAP